MCIIVAWAIVLVRDLCTVRFRATNVGHCRL
jgi:hypothetical protein